MNIHINKCYKTSAGADHPLKIYTNISVDPETGEWRDGGNMFNTSDLKIHGGPVGAAILKAMKELDVLPYGENTGAHAADGVRQVYPLREDPRYAGRLYSITVTLKDPKGRTTHYKGTKGAD